MRGPVCIVLTVNKIVALIELLLNNTALTMRVYLHSFSRCYHPKMRTSAKFRENLNFNVNVNHKMFNVAKIA